MPTFSQVVEKESTEGCATTYSIIIVLDTAANTRPLIAYGKLQMLYPIHVHDTDLIV